jgi:excisionase family DNA binding protein
MQFYTVADLTQMLRLSASQVYALIDAGKLRVHRFTTRKNGAVRISQAQLDAYLRSTESVAAAPPHEAPPEQSAPTGRSRPPGKPSAFVFLPPKQP